MNDLVLNLTKNMALSYTDITILIIIIFLPRFTTWLKNYILKEQTIQTALKNIQKDITKIYDIVHRLIKVLSKQQFFTAEDVTFVYEQKSPKQITDEGKKLLDKNNIDEFLSNNCKNFINKDYSSMREVDIYINCVKYVKENHSDKALSLTYDNNLSEENAKTLLALAVRDKILEK